MHSRRWQRVELGIAIVLAWIGFQDGVAGENGAVLSPLRMGPAVQTNGLGWLDASSAHWALEVRTPKAYLAAGAGGAADFNGDGRLDFALSAPRMPGRRFEIGKVWSVTPEFDSGSVKIDWSWMPPFAMPQRAGSPLAAGDFNGDGFSDLVVGVPRADLEAGNVLIFEGGTNHLSASPSWKKRGTRSRSYFGVSIAVADLNRDGYGDLIVGESNWQGRGRVAIFNGSRGGLADAPNRSYTGSGADNERFGSTLALLDANGDGDLDLAVGAPYCPGPHGGFCGEVRLFLGTNGAFAEAPVWIKTGSVSRLGLGLTLAALGDLDRDGFGELAVGGYGFSPTQESGTEGEVCIYHGGPKGLFDTPRWRKAGHERDELFGICVAGVGDVNGDGWPDVLIGASGDRTQYDLRMRGRAELYLGGSNGLPQDPSWFFANIGPRSWTGKYLVALGDLNADQLADFGVFSPVLNAPETGSSGGRLDVFFGRRSGYGRTDRFPWNSRAVRLVDGLIAERRAARELAAQTEQAARRGRSMGWLSVVLAGLLAVALGWGRWRRARLALLAAHRAAVEARQAVANDLHDGLGADVHIIRRLTERLNSLPDDSSDAGECRAQLLQASQRLSGSMQRFIAGVNPDGDTLENIVTFLADYAPSVLRPHAIDCELDLEPALPERTLSGQARQHLFLAVNELLNNVVRHSGAKAVCLRVRWSAPILEVQVNDDGRGLKPPHSGAETATSGTGIRSLTKRSLDLGGSIEWRPREPSGTQAMLRLPLRAP